MNIITMQGKQLHLEGNIPDIGSNIKSFSLIANNLTHKSEKDYQGNVLVILTIPSIDTGVCDMEVRKFNENLSSLSDNIKIIAVSEDLPFAQGRWCAAANISNVETLSDYYSNDFGVSYGLLIKESHLLARAILIYDKNGKLVYKELVAELTNEPDYDKAIEAAKKALL